MKSQGLKKSFARQDAERLLPMLRSIGREIRERSQRIDQLEAQLGTLDPEGERRLESELALHRRELRRVERELAQLGCNLDADHPLRILIPGDGEQFAWENGAAQTQFYRKPIDSRA